MGLRQAERHITSLDGTNKWEALAALLVSKFSARGMEKLMRKARV